MDRLLQIVGWRRIVVTALGLLVWRLVYQTPIIGLDLNRLGALVAAQTHTGSVVAALGSSEPYAQFSIGSLGVTPYINAIVVMTLAAYLSNRVRELRWTPTGIHRYRLWTRAIALVIAAGLAYGRVGVIQNAGLLPDKIPWFSWFLIASEITAGTAVLIAVADAIDEHGLGFGFGPLWLYALGPVVFETHRIAGWIANAPSVEALYLPMSVWMVASITIATLTVAAAGAYRLFVSKADEEESGTPRTYSTAFLTSGVVRPVVLAFALVNLPGTLAQLVSRSNPDLANLILSSWQPAGPNPWWSAGYLTSEAIVVVVFTIVIAFGDIYYWIGGSFAPHFWRLTLLCGLFLVLTVVVIPEVELLASSLAGHLLPMSGFDAVLAVAVVFSAVVTLRPIRRPRAIAVPAPAFP